jgi:hypothetical protein
LEKGNVNEKKVFSGAKETHPDILRGGHRNPYQFENAIKSGGSIFCIYPPGNCDGCQAVLKKAILVLKCIFSVFRIKVTFARAA